MDPKNISKLLTEPLQVVNVGLREFADALESQNMSVTHVDWSPPAGGNPETAGLLAKLGSGAVKDKIEKANKEAFERMVSADPVLVDVVPAKEAIPTLGDRMILHAGPPIEWDRMCGPLRGAIAGIAVFEGWAPDLPAAEKMAAEGAFDFSPNHHYGAVGPMTGMTTVSQPVLVVENRKFGNRSFCTINEGLGKVMRFGGNDEEVLDRLRWLRDGFGPALGGALRNIGGIPLKNLVARGLSMGDEMHQRNVGCTGLILKELAPILARTASDVNTLERALAFIGGNEQFFLNIAMAMGKAIMDPVAGIENACVVTAMSRNGTDFGVRVSATGDEWFTASVEMPKGLYFPGFTEDDANPDMGDSSILETVGLGGFAMAASPSVAGFVGAGMAADAINFTRSMTEITVGENLEWTIPAMDYTGIPTGIDIRLVIETGLVPTINTGMAHKKPGVGQVGAGVARAPMACFEKALETFAGTVGAK